MWLLITIRIVSSGKSDIWTTGKQKWKMIETYKIQYSNKSIDTMQNEEMLNKIG